jgi:Rrf2 family protein
MTRIAAEANVPRKFLELILADLRDARLVDSFRGKLGGYVLARPAHLISLGDIIRVIEGPLALVPCVSRTAYRRCTDCKSEADCAIRHAMMRVRDETARILDGTSLADATAETLAAA